MLVMPITVAREAHAGEIAARTLDCHGNRSAYTGIYSAIDRTCQQPKPYRRVKQQI